MIGVPIKSRISLDGWDSVLSILQMPPGVPVATVAIDGARNAGILAAQIIGVRDADVRDRVAKYKTSMESTILDKANQLLKMGPRDYLKQRDGS
ncbi:MAG: 5-(carboxyamino)imidazole ribonucleotide mutase [Rhodothermales bacterium]